MSDLFAGWRFALQRLRAGWRFMIVAALGVLVAATLLAITPIYAASMSDLGLRFRLDRELPTPEDRLTYVWTEGLRLGSNEDRAAAAAMNEVTEARIGWLGDVLLEERTERYDISFPGHEPLETLIAVTERTDDPIRQWWGGYVHYVTDWEDHVEVVEGRLPGPASNGPEIVLQDGFQRHSVLGDTLLLESLYLDDCPNIPPSDDPSQAAEEVRCRPTARATTSVEATIVGYVRPNDPADPRWQIFGGKWEVLDAPFYPRLDNVLPDDPLVGLVPTGHGQMAMFTTREQLEQVFAPMLPETSTRHRVGVAVETERVGVGDVQYVIRDSEAWLTDIRDGLDLLAPARTRFIETVERFRNAQSFSAVPLLVVLLQVVGIVFYYVIMVMAMLLDRQKQEIGVYRSRGATTTQLIGLSLVEAVAFAIPALLIAPWLAARVVELLGRTPTFELITGGEPLPATVSPEAYLLAVAGGALSLLAVLLPAFIVVRRGIVDVKREESRPAEKNLLQRYYLDFALVALAALLLWQLNQRGSVFDADSVGGWSSDPVLLAAPFAITAAVSLMVLRFYPPLIRTAVRMLLVFRSTATAIGLRRAGRAPGSYARVALLVIMAVAVGTFAASYGPTVDRSLEDRARYAAGVDIRATVLSDTDRTIRQGIVDLEALEGVQDADGVYRGTLQSATGREVPLLAVDPQVALQALWWRDDFAQRPLAELMRLLQSDIPPGGGYELPADTVAVEMQIKSNQPERALIRAKFRRSDATYVDDSFEVEAEPEEWTAVRASIPAGEGPFTLAGLGITDRTGQNLRQDGSLSIDNIAAVLSDGTVRVIEDFEGPMRWMMLAGPEVNEEFALNADEAFDGAQSVTWTWGAMVTPRRRILAPGDPAIPVSVLMDERALGEFRTAEGAIALAQLDEVILPLRVRAVVDYFPTLDPLSGIVVVNLAHLQSAAGLADSSLYSRPNELWIDVEPSMSLGARRDLLTSLETAERLPRVARRGSILAVEVERAASDPTLQAAGSGILAVAFIAVLGLCAVGFVVTMVLGARGRAVEFAVLRAIGASRREILRALLLEWGIVLVAGAAVGGFVGRQVARIMLDFLNVTEQGDRVLPPFQLMTNWVALGLGLGTLVGVVLASLVIAWATSMRRAPTIELRVTQ